jgi:hypothetical protein
MPKKWRTHNHVYWLSTHPMSRWSSVSTSWAHRERTHLYHSIHVDEDGWMSSIDYSAPANQIIEPFPAPKPSKLRGA